MSRAAPSPAPPSVWPARLGIALVSAAVLLLEVAVTRVLSVVLWYHFAFLSVSLAMLALGAPGVWFALRPPREGTLGRALLAGGVLVPPGLVAIVQGGGTLASTSARAALVVAALLPPLLALGAAVCLLLLDARGQEIAPRYGFDLLGATVGALAVVPLLGVVPTPQLVALAGLLPLGAAALVAPRLRVAASVAGVCVVGLAAWGAPLHLTWTKSYDERGKILAERWTPLSRVAVFESPFFRKDPAQAFAWGMNPRTPRPSIPQLWLEQDGSAGTPITSLAGGLDALGYLLDDVTSAAYQAGTPHSACVIGAGGGRDVLTALRAGVRRVVAVELNPAVVEAASRRYGAFAGNAYALPGVETIVGEGRSVLTRRTERFDVLQVSLVDTWAATAAGAYALAENYLYTQEALALYWQRLTDDGVVSISRWMDGEHMLEAARLALLARAALARAGVDAPDTHLALVQAGPVGTLLIARRAFDAARLARLDEVCAARGFTRHWPAAAGTPRDSLVALVLAQGPQALERAGADLSPPTDDRPFFFQTVGVLRPLDAAVRAHLAVNEQSVVLLRRLALLVGLLAVVLFAAPFVGVRQLVHGADAARGSGFFVAIGLGFMLTEVPLIQRLALFLGHPSYATTVVLAALLLGAGCGSLVAPRLAPRGRTWLAALAGAVLVVDLALGPVTRAALGWGLGARIGVALAVLVPLGFLMGLPFALGMTSFDERDRAWFWALNGVAGVLASILSLGFAMAAGFTAVMACGGLAYAAAAATWCRPSRPGSLSRGTERADAS